MKKLLIGVVLILINIQLSAQKKQINVDYREVKIGHNSLTNRDILANEYLFPDNIYNYKKDSINNTLALQIRSISKNGKWLSDEGDFVLYDIANNQVKWNKHIYYNNETIHKYDNFLIHTKGNKSYNLDPENGNELWKTKNKIFYADAIQKVGFGYFNTMNEKRINFLTGTNLSNGEWLWYRYINREYGWNEIFQLNDSVIMIVAAGLHTVNLKTGEGWDYDTVTGKKNYSRTNAVNAAGVVLGALTGTFVISLGYDIVGDVRSNVLKDSMDYYFASNSKIARIAPDGKMKWRQELSEDQTSKSYLFTKDSFLYMVNYGFAFLRGRQLNVGRPFLASFNTSSGTQKYLAQVGDKKDELKDLILKGDTMMFLLKDKLLNYSLKDGKIISEKDVETKDEGEPVCFLGNSWYIKVDSTYQTMVSLDKTKQYLH
jgi:hypothetical protein